MTKSWISFICILLCVLMPFAAIAAVIFVAPAQFGETFLGALSVKVDRIESIEEPKIVIVGGSSVPFGVDSKQMEEMLGMPVVNFGLYASLGTKIMLDLSREYINEGDIIVLAPETDAQTYSLFFGADSSWQAVDSDISLLPKIAKDNFSEMLGSSWKHAALKMKYLASGTKLDPSGIYNAKSFDEYGDIIYPRKYNHMELMYDPTLEIKLSPEIISADFIDYVNEYVDYAKEKGARVLFSFAPMNFDAISADTTVEQVEAFANFIYENFKTELISDPNMYMYESGYFYDSNFHLNEAGMVYHTYNLACDIATVCEMEILKEYEIPDMPEVPENPEENVDGFPTDYDENEQYFVFKERYVSGELKGYDIVSLTGLGSAQASLTTPYAYEGMRVYTVKESAFAGCMATEIYITENIASIEDGAFAGANSLEKVHILAENPDSTTVNNLSGELCNGMPADAKFYVPAASYDTYVGNYFWGPYADKIVAE